MTLANTSAHLQVLRAAGLLEATKEGLFAPLDPLLGRATTLGAAFLALEAQKPATR